MFRGRVSDVFHGIFAYIFGKYSVTVYIWLPRPGFFGHAAMKLPNPYGDYISWWPEGPKEDDLKEGGTAVKIRDKKGDIKGGLEVAAIGAICDVALGRAAKPSSGLFEDIHEEGGVLPQVYTIQVSHPDRIKTWWAGQQYERYNLTRNNCCDMVIKALQEGGFQLDSNEYLPSLPEELAEKLISYRDAPAERQLKDMN